MKILMSRRMAPPKLREQLIPRTVLIQKIQQGFTKKVTVLEAGAGHGKTVALRQALTALPSDSWRWLNVSADSDDPMVFWSYFLETMAPFLGEQKAQVFAYFQQSLHEQSLADFGCYLLEMLPEKDYYLVLDDVHFIENEALVASLDAFIAALPAQLHLFLVTRYPPKVYLGQLLLENELYYLQEADFLLSPEEAQALTDDLGFKDLDVVVKKAVMEKAQGWLGGLQLLLLAGNVKVFAATLPTEKALVFDYLTKEILANLPAQEKEFLVATAYYPFMFPELATTLFPEVTYTDMMNQLQSQNLMLTQLSDTHYVYHPLIRDSLIRAFLEQPVALREHQQRQAAAVFLTNGYEDEGIALLLELQAYTQLMALIVAQPASLRTSYYVKQVPDDVAVTNIDFAFQKLFYYYTILDYEKLEQLMLAVEEAHPLLRDVKAFDGMRLLLGMDDSELVATLLPVKTIQALPLAAVSKAFIVLKNAMICYFKNEFRQAICYVKESMVLNRRSKNPFINYFNQTFLAQIYEEIGDFQQGLRLLKQTHEKIATFSDDEQANTNYQLSFNLTITGIHLKRMELTLAEKALKQIVYQQHPHMRASYLYNLAEWHYLKGEDQAAFSVVQKLDATDYYQSLRMKAGLCKYLLKRDQLTAEQKQSFLAEYDQLPHKSLSDLLFYSMLSLACQKHQQALLAVDQVLEISRRERIYFRIIGADLCKIELLLQQACCDKRGLQALYHEAIHYGQENQILSEFFLYRKELAKLYQHLGAEVSDAFEPAERQFHERVQTLLSPKVDVHLSQREQEVLDELAQGFTNKEIAAHLFISLATTKTHVLNIYRKLGVNSRVKAIEAARQLQLLTAET